MKRMLLLVPVLAVTAAIVLATTGGAQAPGERTLKFVAKGGSSKFVDNPPRQRRRNQPPSPGDAFLFSSPEYDQNGARVGTVVLSCLIGPGKGLPTDCTANLKLSDGTITFAGRATGSRTTVLAVTGGTGAYEGARGSVTSINRTSADNSPSDDIIHLLP
jgi:hypothetical protein